MQGHYIENAPIGMISGSMCLSQNHWQPLASTIYGIRDVHLVKLVYDLGHSDSTGSIGSDFIERLDLSFDLVNYGAGQIPLFYH